ncbi:NAD(P)-dependent oxidoreductase [Mesorhizobium sp. NPDC059054]|uniref:NAD(P)-dependent oxidoreductase n=1 Tax=Mesorhizobium sp. NPDC059054 TaxID=3346711 RepID=UPI0036A3C5E2
MSDVTMIGLGEMGSALGRAFLAGGKSVTVWNRTPAKAAALERLGAVRASTVAGAIAASPVVVICLSDYAAASGVLGEDGVAETLDGQLIVQLSSGTPDQARELKAQAVSSGANYLDGAIGAWPRQIGGPEAGLLIVGNEDVFASAEPLLKLLAGGLSYVGSNIGHAKAFSNAGLAYFAAHWIGFSHGAAICEAEGIDAGTFGEVMAGMAPFFGEDMRHMGRVIAEDRFGDPEATIKTITSDIGWLVESSRDLKIGVEFPKFAASIFLRAKDAGFGGEEPSALIKVLRKA